MMTCVFQVVGPQNSGKTLVIEKAVRSLKQAGLTVAVVKHSHHELDLRGKDTDRLARSGSDFTLFVSDKCVLFFSCDPVKLISLLPADVVLVEGFAKQKLGERLEISNPDQAESLASKIMEKGGKCSVAEEVLIDGQMRTVKGDLALMVNIMKFKNIKGVRR
jgi:molybdopterin-guanine dinucleotide biosynthesis protein B